MRLAARRRCAALPEAALCVRVWGRLHACSFLRASQWCDNAIAVRRSTDGGAPGRQESRNGGLHRRGKRRLRVEGCGRARYCGSQLPRRERARSGGASMSVTAADPRSRGCGFARRAVCRAPRGVRIAPRRYAGSVVRPAEADGPVGRRHGRKRRLRAPRATSDRATRRELPSAENVWAWNHRTSWMQVALYRLHDRATRFGSATPTIRSQTAAPARSARLMPTQRLSDQ